MADPVSAGIVLGSTLLSAFSSFGGGKRKKRRARLIARQKELQASELERRTELEISLMEDQRDAVVGRGRAQFAGNNIDVGSGASVQAEMQSFEAFTQTALNRRIETEFRQDQLRLEGKLGIADANDMARAGNITAIAGVAGAAGSFAGSFSKKPGGS